MKLYTRTGDQGQTRLIGNQVVMKDDPCVEAYGTIDEVNSYMGLVIASPDLSQVLRDDLLLIQQYLFDCGTDIANQDQKIPYRTKEDWVLWLERKIDGYETIPPKLESFILPGGCQAAAHLQYARALVRRAERQIVTYMRQHPVNSHVLKFLNRLSDYLFVAARLANFEAGISEPVYVRSGKVFR